MKTTSNRPDWAKAAPDDTLEGFVQEIGTTWMCIFLILGLIIGFVCGGIGIVLLVTV